MARIIPGQAVLALLGREGGHLVQRPEGTKMCRAYQAKTETLLLEALTHPGVVEEQLYMNLMFPLEGTAEMCRQLITPLIMGVPALPLTS